ncbi:hypothetical protein [Spongiactinospora sp. TRM90649]|uniref:hypothetical protein n=1 Tax=Spongiactinospora sp. TRM90649 TaxID=3031114 RepID=UPI0023F706CE|nr:hypothetical protein [Spongiactinospora sp. TRM90649]MDF5758282.1 hypothetical protein [Spongiactinospora sp. TRM90649]
MIKRVMLVLAAPVMFGAALVTATPAAATVPDAPIECRLEPVRNGRASLVQCREHGAYVHWVQCKQYGSRATEDIVREFVGTRSVISCEPGSRVVSHSIGG